MGDAIFSKVNCFRGSESLFKRPTLSAVTVAPCFRVLCVVFSSAVLLCGYLRGMEGAYSVLRNLFHLPTRLLKWPSLILTTKKNRENFTAPLIFSSRKPLRLTPPPPRRKNIACRMTCLLHHMLHSRKSMFIFICKTEQCKMSLDMVRYQVVLERKAWGRYKHIQI